MIVPAILTAAALGTAVISGIAGLGGGTMLVAVMFAVSLAPGTIIPVHAAVQLTSNAARTVVFSKHVHWASLLVFLLAAAPTPFVAAPWVKRLDARWVKLGMGLFLLAVTWVPVILRARRQARELAARASENAASESAADAPSSTNEPPPPTPEGWLPPTLAILAAGLLAGGLGMVVGATGALIAPFYLRDSWSKDTTIGTKALCQGSAHVLKLVAFSTHGFALGKHLALVVPMSVAVVVGTVIGKRIGTRLSEVAFQRIFRALLTLLSLKLIVFAAYKLLR